MDGPDETPAHYHDLGAVEVAAWAAFEEGARSRKSAFHQVTIATVTRHGLPAVRTVVLRGADEAARTLRFHTDSRSRKYAELLAEPRCELHGYDHDAKIQVRARGTARLHNGDEPATALWQGMRDMSKACYRQPRGPGECLERPEEADAGGPLSDENGLRNFVMVQLHVCELEWLYLAAAGHRRALVTYGEEPSRCWLAP